MAFTIIEENKKKILTECAGEKGFVEIPEGVTEVGNGDCAVFADNEASLDFSVKGVKIPGSVKKINDAAFYRTCVDSVEFSEGLEEIGVNAFRKSFTGPGKDVQTEITLPKSLKKIKNGAFSGTKINKVSVCDDVIIEPYAFPDDTEVNFYDKDGKPSKNICQKAFKLEEDEHRLEIRKAEVEAEKREAEQSGNEFLAALCLAPAMCYKVTGVNNYAVSKLDFNSFLTEDGYFEYTEIGDEAFSECNLIKKVIIPESITKIGKGAFNNESLKTAIIPADCKIVKEYWGSDDYKNSFLKNCDVFKYENYDSKGYSTLVLREYIGTKNIVTVPDSFGAVDACAFNQEEIEVIVVSEDCKILNKEVLDESVRIYNKNGMRVL